MNLQKEILGVPLLIYLLSILVSIPTLFVLLVFHLSEMNYLNAIYTRVNPVVLRVTPVPTKTEEPSPSPTPTSLKFFVPTEAPVSTSGGTTK